MVKLMVSCISNVCIPAISVNESQSLIEIDIIDNNQLIIIDWFNQSIKIDTHSPIRLNCY